MARWNDGNSSFKEIMPRSFKLFPHLLLLCLIEADLREMTNAILRPGFTLQLRIQGTLLFGVTVIYDRKCKSLLEASNEALLKLRTTIWQPEPDRPEATDRHLARFQTITIPEKASVYSLVTGALLTGADPTLGEDESRLAGASIAPVRFDVQATELTRQFFFHPIFF